MLRHAPALLRLTLDLRQFRRHFAKLRAASHNASRRELIEADSVLRRYYHESGRSYINRRRLEPLMSEFLEQALWASFFHDPRDLPAFIILQCLLPMIVPTYSFILDFQKIASPFADAIEFNTVTSVHKNGDTLTLETKNGQTHETDIIVLATPMTAANALVAPQKIKGIIECSFLHVRGQIKPEYAVRGYNFFAIKDACAISHEADGSYLYFYTGTNRVADYFNSWEVITAKTWQPALFLLGDEYLNLNPEPGIFLANDHDVASTEDAFLNGQYTAKLVMQKMSLSRIK